MYMKRKKNGQIDGFIGINDCYIEGLFVKESAQSMGIENVCWIM